ncbi:MAG: hypothetical protein AAGD25_16955 [Cyanobacteria bacterium P01_F01_bin.150]
MTASEATGSLPRGLRQKELCEYFNWDYRSFVREAKEEGLSTHAYLEQKTGWYLYKELWYPPTSTPPSSN